MKRSTFIRLALAASVAPTTLSANEKKDKARKLILIAGKPSHPPMMHEFRAGTILLEKCLKEIPGLIVERHEKGWVDDEKTFDDADAVVCFSDGNKRHPALEEEGRLQVIEKFVKRGVGFGCMHYGVEVPKEVAGDKFFNMRFAEGFDASGPKEIEGVKFVPILIAKPSDEVRNGPYVHPRGPYPHIEEASGRGEAIMWSVERPDGGRGFGFTGGHFHTNWQNDNFRKTILNALCWISKVEIPEDGIASAPVSDQEILENLDVKKPRKRK